MEEGLGKYILKYLNVMLSSICKIGNMSVVILI